MNQRLIKTARSSNLNTYKRANSNIYLYSLNEIKNSFIKSPRKTSEFKTKLKERKKLAILYGNISKKQIQRMFYKASHYEGTLGDNVLKLLESRLDTVLYRIFFFKSIYSARQWIRCNKILVNNRIVNIPSYQVSAGDVISIVSTNKKTIAELIKYSLKNKSKIGLQTTESSNWRKMLKQSVSLNNEPNSLFSDQNKDFEKKRETGLGKKVNNEFLPEASSRFFLTPALIQSIGYSLLNTALSPQLTGKTFTQNSKLNRAIMSILSKEWAKLTHFQKVGLQQIFYLLETQNSLNLRINPLLLELKLKRLFYRHRSQRLTALKLSFFKPMHIEVSYKLLTAIYLFSPQKITYPSLIDMDLILKSLT